MASAPGETDDLASLAKLDEDVLMNELKVRFSEDKIYTYVGDIVVAVNPYRDVGIYTKKHAEKYNNARRGEHPPHVFAVSDMAYQAMLGLRSRAPQNQCILISGESGAGKTESTKLIIKQLIELSQGKNQLEQQIIQVNPLLESFGNAQTMMNDNSSRFGRYIMLRFLNGNVKGSKISEYLLEKSRVIHQGQGEQNFHVFYYMFAGMTPEQQQYFQLDNPKDYRYFTDGASCLKDPKTSALYRERYEELENAMDIVGFTEQEQSDMFTILAGLLHHGNMVVEDKDEYAHISDKGALQKAATLLGLPPESLRDCLTCSETFTRGYQIRKNYSKMEAEDSRDAVAKAIYGRLFSWIVNKVNTLLAPEDIIDPEDTQEIGILDIFGFEHFVKNSFEQACINLANEQLQAFFNKHIFLLEQEEYQREGVDWAEIKWKDNLPLLELFLAKPIGLMALLDEESLFPRATDQTFVEKLNMKFDDNFNYQKANHAGATSFTIRHYAGAVKYSGKGWLVKNRDTLPPGVHDLLQNSQNPLLSHIFKGDTMGGIPQGPPLHHSSYIHVKNFADSMSPPPFRDFRGYGHISRTGTLAFQGRTKHTTQRKALRSAQESMARKLTVGAQFRNSLNVLLDRMNSSQPVFVRCIKPNTEKKALTFDDAYVKKQLLYTGMLETIRIRRDGFAIRPTFKEFMQKYELVLNQFGANPSAENCTCILKRCKLEGWKMGKTKVFLRLNHLEALTDAMEVYVLKVIQMQRLVRGFLGRCRGRKCRENATKESHQMVNFLSAIEAINISLVKKLNEKNEEDTQILSAKLERRELERASQMARDHAEAAAACAAAATAAAAAAAAIATTATTTTECGVDPIPNLNHISTGTDAALGGLDAATETDEILDDEFERVKPKMVSSGTGTDYGEIGTRAASIRWFKTTQADHLQTVTGQFEDWFHGIIKRRDAEVLLKDQPLGCFLVRVGESRFGYTLTFKAHDKIRHYMINLTRSQKFNIVGEPKVHRSLHELVNFYQMHELSNWDYLLTAPCGQMDGHCDYSELLEDDSQVYCDIETPLPSKGPPTLPPRIPESILRRNMENPRPAESPATLDGMMPPSVMRHDSSQGSEAGYMASGSVSRPVGSTRSYLDVFDAAIPTPPPRKNKPALYSSSIPAPSPEEVRGAYHRLIEAQQYLQMD